VFEINIFMFLALEILTTEDEKIEQ